MKLYFRYFFLILLILISSCSKEEKKVSIVKETNLEAQMIEAYNAGLEELNKGDAIYAAKRFSEAELLYPQSEWAPRASLMSAYSYFTYYYYSDAIYELERFLKVHGDKDELEQLPDGKYIENLPFNEA